MTNDRLALSSERTRQDDSYCKGQTWDLTSGNESQTGLDTKTDWLTDRQSQCDFDFDFDFQSLQNPEDEGSDGPWNVGVFVF
jgi:hypothetical protein